MKKKFKIVSDKDIEETSGQVPLYRSYGVQKKVNPFIIALNVLLTRTLFVLVFGAEIAIIVLCAIMFFRYGGPLLCVTITLPTVIVFTFLNTRIPRRRYEFVRRLKKVCRKNSYELKFKRGFWRSLDLCIKDGADFILRADGKTYCIKYITPKSPLTSVSFISKNEIRYTKHARKNIFTLVFSRRDKHQILRAEFPKDIADDKSIIKGFLVNPRPRDIWLKDENGAIVPTGTGEEIYGYTIFTGKGFMSMLQREHEEAQIQKAAEINPQKQQKNA